MGDDVPGGARRDDRDRGHVRRRGDGSAWADIDLDALAGISVPIQLSQGDQSPPFFAKIIARLSESMTGAEVTVLPGAGHVPHVTHPAEYLAVITRFMGR